MEKFHSSMNIEGFRIWIFSPDPDLTFLKMQIRPGPDPKPCFNTEVHIAVFTIKKLVQALKLILNCYLLKCNFSSLNLTILKSLDPVS